MPMTRRAFLKRPLPQQARQYSGQLRERGKPPPYDSPTTANAKFFRQYTRTPSIYAPYWGFSIGGAVRYPLSLSYADLLAMPAEEIPCTLLCAANPPGGERIGHAIWRGVRLSTLLNELEIDAGVRYGRLEAADQHITSVPMEQLHGALLAYAMNGDTLTPEQGFPVRLIVPGLYDYKSPRWIERIELSDAPTFGDWEARGWPLDGIIETTSGITAPRAMEIVSGVVRLEGYAFAGAKTIEGVEISIDGTDWVPVAFTPPPPNVWARWAIDWPAPAVGDYQVRVRAWDSMGTIRADETLHAIVMRVREG